MATKFYNVEKAAELLGVTPAEINAMRERQELHGYRDGSDWKFKAEEIEQLAQQSAGSAGEEDDVLLSEVELGESDPSASGTVIGPPPGVADGGRNAVDSAVSGLRGSRPVARQPTRHGGRFGPEQRINHQPDRRGS